MDKVLLLSWRKEENYNDYNTAHIHIDTAWSTSADFYTVYNQCLRLRLIQSPALSSLCTDCIITHSSYTNHSVQQEQQSLHSLSYPALFRHWKRIFRVMEERTHIPFFAGVNSWIFAILASLERKSAAEEQRILNSCNGCLSLTGLKNLCTKSLFYDQE